MGSGASSSKAVISDKYIPESKQSFSDSNVLVPSEIDHKKSANEYLKLPVLSDTASALLAIERVSHEECERSTENRSTSHEPDRLESHVSNICIHTNENELERNPTAVSSIQDHSKSYQFDMSQQEDYDDTNADVKADERCVVKTDHNGCSYDVNETRGIATECSGVMFGTGNYDSDDNEFHYQHDDEENDDGVSEDGDSDGGSSSCSMKEENAAMAAMFSNTALSLGIDNDELLFNMMYFGDQQAFVREGDEESDENGDSDGDSDSDGEVGNLQDSSEYDAVSKGRPGDIPGVGMRTKSSNMRANAGMNIRNMLNSTVEETIAAHSANNTYVICLSSFCFVFSVICHCKAFIMF